MRKLLEAISRVVFWTYARGSWQYDVLCALILAFIFLTPKEYFVRPPFFEGEEHKVEEQQDRKGEKTTDKKREGGIRLSHGVTI